MLNTVALAASCAPRMAPRGGAGTDWQAYTNAERIAARVSERGWEGNALPRDDYGDSGRPAPGGAPRSAAARAESLPEPARSRLKARELAGPPGKIGPCPARP
jgi:hypothetical protein